MTPGHLLTGTTGCNEWLRAPGSAFRSHCRPTHGTTSPRTSVPLRAAGTFSQWPETLGLAAIGSAELVESFADIARQEYLAVGLRLALHPQIDLATEPRWSRISGGFGEDADLTSSAGAGLHPRIPMRAARTGIRIDDDEAFSRWRAAEGR